ncbi:MAG: leucyl aminopeptidase family protein, partial [Desulfuromonadales bacterium]
MEIKIHKTRPLQTKTACLVIGVFEKGLSEPLLQELDQKLGGLLHQARRHGEFTGKDGEQILFQPAGHLPAKRVLLIGLGKRAESCPEKSRQAAGRAMQHVIGKKLGQAAFALPLATQVSDSIAHLQATAEGILLASYRYDRFLGEKARESRKIPKLLTLLIDTAHDKQTCEAALERAQIICRAVMLARDLVNAPGNVKSPVHLAEQARAAAEASTLQCKILGLKELAEEGFGALLGVAQGSVREPQLIVLEHRGGSKNEAPVALVGKGVTFDAGGISLKPPDKMDEMKMDMAGGAAVIGTMLAAALLRLPINLVGIVPAVENLPSGTAYRPGD